MNPSSDYSSTEELLQLCKEHNTSIAEIALRREIEESGKPREFLLQKMASYYDDMREAIRRGLAIQSRSHSGLSGGEATKLWSYAQTPTLLGSSLTKVIAYGFAVLEHNAQFGRIVATPTAGSSGIVPACLYSLEETHKLSREQATLALFTAAGIGILIGKKACFSGARGGCQAEVGSACSIAAGAIVEATGGTPHAAIHAASFALMNTLGLVCDPIGGYVEVPCVSRNGMYAVHAFLAATMAQAGLPCIVPFDEVILAMRDIGRRMPPALKETAQGGLAITPTGLKHQPEGFAKT